MTQQFNVGDTVRLNGTDHVAEVVEIDPHDPNLVLCEIKDKQGQGTKIYHPASALTMVKAAADYPPDMKIET